MQVQPPRRQGWKVFGRGVGGGLRQELEARGVDRRKVRDRLEDVEAVKKSFWPSAKSR